MTVTIARRELLVALGGAAASWPLAARAQQPAMPVIGLLESRSPDAISDRLRISPGPQRHGPYRENIAIEYRFAENQIDRLPTLAADLVRRQVAVIATAGPSATFAVKAATATIPSLFAVAEDPVRLDLGASLARPGGNLTGINVFNSELVTKRLELLRELVPRAKRVAVLVDPADEANTRSTLRDAEAAARAMGLRIQVVNATTKREIDAAFEATAREKADALFVGAFPFLNGQGVQLVQLAAFHRLPATYSQRPAATGAHRSARTSMFQQSETSASEQFRNSLTFTSLRKPSASRYLRNLVGVADDHQD